MPFPTSPSAGPRLGLPRFIGKRGVRWASLLAMVVMLAGSALSAQAPAPKAAAPKATGIEAKAQALFQQNKFPEAFAAYKQCAGTGSAVCQDWLGYMYMYGIGVAEDDALAFQWNTKAAKQGLAIAETNLAWKYWKGIGVIPDIGDAMDWFEKAAKQGQPYAETILGYIAEKGYISEPNYPDALAFYTKAAQQGYPYAETDLGYMYLIGNGVVPDRAKAKAYFEKAAAAGEVNAQGFLEQMNAALLPSTQLQHATTAVMTVPGYPVPAADPAPLSADEQDHVAQTMTSEEMYGLATLDTAALTKRAASGNPLVEFVLAVRLRDAKDQAQADALMKKALPLFEHGSKLGNPLAEFILGDFYLEGVAYPKDTAKAIDQLREAAHGGNVPAFKMLGYAYRDGLLGVGKDLGQSFYWFHMLASYGPNSASVYHPLPDSFIFPTAEYLAKMAARPPEVKGFSQLYVAPAVPVPGKFGMAQDAPLPVLFKDTAWPQQPVPTGAPGTYGIPALNCVAENRDTGGMPTFANQCSYRIHLIWTPLKPGDDDQPYYSTYLEPGQLIVTETTGGMLKYYACQYNHLIVGPDGKPITSVVEDFRCLKQ